MHKLMFVNTIKINLKKLFSKKKMITWNESTIIIYKIHRGDFDEIEYT